MGYRQLDLPLLDAAKAVEFIRGRPVRRCRDCGRPIGVRQLSLWGRCKGCENDRLSV